MLRAIFIAVMIGISVLSFAGVVNLGQKSPDQVQFISDQEELAGVFTAAECAGFPPSVAADLERRHGPEQFVQLANLPDSYEIKMVVVHTTAGGCLTTPAPLLPKVPLGKALRLYPAVAATDPNDVKGEGLPFYVLWELKAQEGSLDRVFVTMRLPEPVSDDRPSTPSNIA